MLLTLTTTHRPATDLGYLLHKNPARVQSFELSFGHAHVFYPEASEERCTAALLLDVDAVGLVRDRKGPAGESFALGEYVSDRPYAASSFLSVAMARVFASALAGRSRGRQQLAQTPIALTARIAALPCRGGAGFLRALFEPLGYTVRASRHALDERSPEWGESPYHTVELQAEKTLSELLTHLYLLVPVLDDDKHYWVGEAEVEKLLKHGAGWLAGHPEKEAIAYRYLKHRRGLVRQTIARLVDEDQQDVDEQADAHEREEEALERRLSLNEERLGAVLAALKASGATRVLDLGCGEGKLLRRLLDEKPLEEIVGVDVSSRTLERAADRLKLDRLPEAKRRRIRLLQGSLTYRDRRLFGFDAAAVVEVVEHLDPSRLLAFARVLFECARPRTVILTTPNAEYNVRFEGLPAGRLRHSDHRFEWTRAEFAQWSEDVGRRFGYDVRRTGIGAHDDEVGEPTQMAVFERQAS
ncbi:MAG TPA: 3' terminal RNA ribose 2'-O-methyltransferase Hen1 [Vicinamibacteria bacterium]|nr:3' terminal RNA ribose 2'-O-methyltransferase Hen1 [Vicinamibacteria bacterium]